MSTVYVYTKYTTTHTKNQTKKSKNVHVIYDRQLAPRKHECLKCVYELVTVNKRLLELES